MQEELAERISAMVHVFRAAGDDHKGFLPFVRCGLVTLGREWFGIDRWRMDKFMMFVRRFLRQVLAYSKNKDWENSEALAQVTKQIGCYVRFPNSNTTFLRRFLRLSTLPATLPQSPLPARAPRLPRLSPARPPWASSCTLPTSSWRSWPR